MNESWSFTCSYPGNYTFYSGYSYDGLANQTAGASYSPAFWVDCLGSAQSPPDLVASAGYSPVPAVVGEPVALNIEASNVGAGFALPFNVTVSPIDGYGIVQPPIYGFLAWGGLQPGAFVQQQFTFNPCAGASTQDFQVSAVPASGSQDSNLSNNDYQLAFNCTLPLPELSESVAVSNSSPQLGQRIFINYTTLNIGNGTASPSSTGISILNSTGSAVMSGYSNLGALGPNESVTDNVTFSCVTGGAFTITATADVFGQVNQTGRGFDASTAQLVCLDQYSS